MMADESDLTPTESQEISAQFRNLGTSDDLAELEITNGQPAIRIRGGGEGGGGLGTEFAGAISAARSISPGNISQNSQDSCHAMDVEEKGELDVKVQHSIPNTLRRMNSCSHNTDMAMYRMEAKPRGLALIIEIEKFENNVFYQRIGSQFDVMNLQELFKQLSFKVEVHRNLGYRDFMALLQNFASHPDHHKADMMVLTILSHGRDGHIYTANGRVIITEKIFEMFNNNNCPALRGKPKFFIIQACRGDTTDSGRVKVEKEKQTDEEEQGAMKRSRLKRPGGSERDTIPFQDPNPELEKARPSWEDMIIAYSTIPGYTSIRDHEKGTWFIQSLVETFMNHAHEYELIDLLRMTSQYLSRFTNESQEKQTCNIEMRHLYKRIYFNPGIPQSATPSPKALRKTNPTPPTSP